ncbi:MAG: LD-carboxypeptidase [Bacteroidia bacterium]|nr:LD-carboxypeptidase [Bacteroidia bacterium]NNJ55150.1 LD-carboxypeptidase [Bacteroidia bacterium]
MYLKRGDTIAIVSPARAIEKEKVEPAIRFFESHGLNVLVGDNVYNIHNQMAGTEADKISDIQSFIDNPKVKAIVSTRGGYGCVRVIDQLNFIPLEEQKKWFVGYSDVTVFHNHIHTNYHVPTIHATMPVNISDSPNEKESISNKTLMDALFGEDIIYKLPNHKLNKAKDAEGILVGGNLSMLYSLCGSKSDIDTNGKILFIEDLDEYLYHIDRMMMNLKRTGKLDNLAGLIVGGMSDMNDNTIPFGKTAEEIILEHTKNYNYPIYFGFEAGHQQPNKALRLGMNAIIRDNQLILSA